MDAMIACCGLSCHECGAFLATVNNDDEKRAETAHNWSKLYNADIKAEDINCNGCLSDSEILFNHCKVCAIRKCCLEKRLVNCAYCNQYICEKLEKFFQIAPESRQQLEKIKNQR